MGVWLAMLLLAAPAPAAQTPQTATIVGEVTDFEGGPHCGYLHVISGAMITVHRSEAGTLPSNDMLVLISCAEMTFRPTRLARYTLTSKRPKGWPGGNHAPRLTKAGGQPWYMVKQEAMWLSGFGHRLGQPASSVEGKKTPYAYRIEGERLVEVSIAVPEFVKGVRAAAMWMGYRPRKGLSPVKREGAWVWPADDERRRLAPGVEGRLKDGRFTVRLVGR